MYTQNWDSERLHFLIVAASFRKVSSREPGQALLLIYASCDIPLYSPLLLMRQTWPGRSVLRPATWQSLAPGVSHWASVHICPMKYSAVVFITYIPKCALLLVCAHIKNWKAKKIIIIYSEKQAKEWSRLHSVSPLDFSLNSICTPEA